MRDLLQEKRQTLLAQFRVRDLARPKHARDLYLVPGFEEADGLSDTGLKIVLRDSRTDLYTLNFLLFALLILSELAFVVLMLTVVDDPTDRRLRGRAYHHEVEAAFTRLVESLSTRHDAELAAIFVDDPDLPMTEDAVVDLGARFRAGRSSKSWYFRSPQASDTDSEH